MDQGVLLYRLPDPQPRGELHLSAVTPHSGRWKSKSLWVSWEQRVSARALQDRPTHRGAADSQQRCTGRSMRARGIFPINDAGEAGQTRAEKQPPSKPPHVQKLTPKDRGPQCTAWSCETSRRKHENVCDLGVGRVFELPHQMHDSYKKRW